MKRFHLSGKTKNFKKRDKKKQQAFRRRGKKRWGEVGGGTTFLRQPVPLPACGDYLSLLSA